MTGMLLTISFRFIFAHYCFSVKLKCYYFGVSRTSPTQRLIYKSQALSLILIFFPLHVDVKMLEHGKNNG